MQSRADTLPSDFEHAAATNSRRGDLALPALAAVAIAVGLFLDSRFGWTGHLAADAFVLTCFLAARRFATPRERLEQLLCVALATAGECFLCFGWGLYEYRHHNLPVFVPLGHSLIFLAGLRIARSTPRVMARIVVPTAAIAVATLAWLGHDRLGLILFPLFLLCLVSRAQRHLYAVMFALSFLVEVAGTAVKSWAWEPLDPWFGLTLTNPPVCAGTFYCVLDVLVVTVMRVIERRVDAGEARVTS